MEILKRTPKTIVYKLPDFSVIGNDFVAALEWPEGINVQMFLFEKPISSECEIMAGISSDRLVGLGYSYSPSKSADSKIKLCAGISPVDLDLEALGRLYYDTQSEFYKKWESELGDSYMKETNMVIEKMLPSAKVAALAKDGRTIALLTTVKWKDCLEQPADWVTWVWIDHTLPKVERNNIGEYFSRWIDVNSDKKVQCFINAFNIRSQKFFRRLGFMPEWFHIVRSK
jgi:hypothetical protein